MGLAEQLAQRRQGVGGHTQAWQFKAPGLFIEQAQHHPLTVGRRQGRNPHVHLMPGQAQGHAAILGHAFCGDIQARHDLEP